MDLTGSIGREEGERTGLGMDGSAVSLVDVCWRRHDGAWLIGMSLGCLEGYGEPDTAWG